MSDHISKNSQAKAGGTNATGIKLKPVTDATKLILDGAKAVVANTNGNDKVLDTDREMDLTFYDANGNVETADPDCDIMQPVKQNCDVFISTEDLFSSDDDDDMPNASGGLDGNGNPDEDASMIAFNDKNQRCDDQARDGDSEMP